MQESGRRKTIINSVLTREASTLVNLRPPNYMRGDVAKKAQARALSSRYVGTRERGGDWMQSPHLLVHFDVRT